MLRRKSDKTKDASPEPEAAATVTGDAGADTGDTPEPLASAGDLAQAGTGKDHVGPDLAEPQTLAEQLSARERKRLAKVHRQQRKQQRLAEKAQRKADRKAAREARRAPGDPEAEKALDLDPLSPVDSGSDAPDRDAPATAPDAPAAVRPEGQEWTGRSPETPAASPPASVGRRTAPLVGGIDLGGTKIAAAVLGPDHKVIAYRRRPTPDRGGPADVVRAMALTMQEAAIDAGTEAHRLLAVGVGAPGSVNAETGALSGAGNLPDWAGTFQLGMALREELGTDVRIGNDVQVGTRAEYELGAGAGYSSLLGVFWGTGVGGGIILDGKLWLGRGRAGEIGHTLVRRGGAKGLNGLSGTVESYAGRKAMEAKARREVKKGRKTKLFKLMKKHDKAHLTSAIWQRALENGDELAEDLLNRAVVALSAGIASSINLLDPEAVVIGGGLGVRFGDTLVPEIIEGMKPYLLNQENPPDVKVAALGDEGGVIGASLLVKDIIEANQAPGF